MAISKEEYKSRLSRLRHGMETAGLHGLLVYSWRRGQVRYLSGYTPNYLANVATVVVPRAEPPTLFMRFPFDLQRAQAMAWFEDVRSSGDIDTMMRDLVSRLRELELEHATIGLVSGDDTMDELPYTMYQQLCASLPGVTFRDARPLLMDLRLRKSPAELALLRRSAAVADAAVAAASALIVPGAGEQDIVRAADQEARRTGASDALVVIAGRAADEQVGPPEDKRLEPGQAVIIEAAVQVEGYWAQVARTFAVGTPTAGQTAVYEASFQAYRRAVQAFAIGTPLGDVYEAAHEVLAAAGYAQHVKHDMGHGLGLDLPEPPRLEHGVTSRVEEGMVLAIHPAVRLPGVGGVFVGGTVLATKDGPKPLHHIPERLA